MKSCKYQKRYSSKSIRCMRDGSIRVKGCQINCPKFKQTLLSKIKERFF